MMWKSEALPGGAAKLGAIGDQSEESPHAGKAPHEGRTVGRVGPHQRDLRPLLRKQSLKLLRLVRHATRRRRKRTYQGDAGASEIKHRLFPSPGARKPDGNWRRLSPMSAPLPRNGAPGSGSSVRAPGRRERARSSDEIGGVPRLEQEPGLAVADELAMAPDVRGDEELPHRHGFERLQRRYRLGEPHCEARVDEDVDEIVIPAHFRVRNPSGKDVVGDAELPRPSAESLLFGPSPTRSNAEAGALFQERGDRLERGAPDPRRRRTIRENLTLRNLRARIGERAPDRDLDRLKIALRPRNSE